MLQEIKDYLKIKWDDEDNNIQGIISRGESYLVDLVGAPLDFIHGQPKALLFDYCRYAYNNSLEYFEENFAREILRLQLKKGVEELAIEE